MAFAQAPLPPVLNSPLHNATGVGTAPTLDVTAADPDGDSLTVTYYGRVAPGPDFTLLPIPDTQFYTGEVRGGSNAMFKAQTDWIVANKAARNTVFVAHLGDCVENGDNGGNPIEWLRADSAMVTIENPLTTGLPDGIPYGVSVGNHDKTPVGSNGTTVLYNQFFGSARFQGRSYYGGHYGSDNDNFFDLLSASGMDFIAISLEYDAGPDEEVLAWADSLLEAHANRRGIVYAHSICNTGNPATFTSMGQDIYDALKDRPNLFLMLGGHVPGEGRRVDTFNGNTVYSVLSAYQGRSNGGNGWLRIMEFSPANDVIRVRTYTPWLNQFEADADSSSQFTLGYAMSSPFTVIGTQ
ncbi:MAG: phosphohydrolase, partial [Patescibacteria group bacterium]